MSAGGADFLSRLAAKAVGTAQLIQPRLASRFEASAEGAGILGSPDVPVESAVVYQRSGHERGEHEQPSSTSPIPRAATAPSRRGTNAPEEVPGAPGEAPRPVAATLQAKPREIVAETARIEAVPARPVLSARSVAPPGEHFAAPDVVRPSLAAPPRSPTIAEPQVARAKPAPEPVAPLPLRDRAGPETASAPPPPTAPVVPLPMLVPQRPPTLTALARPPEILPHRSRRDAGPADIPPPAVKITIGRVEIRAHSPAGAPARPTSPPPRAAPQSLTDYFRHRDAAR